MTNIKDQKKLTVVPQVDVQKFIEISLQREFDRMVNNALGVPSQYLRTDNAVSSLSVISVGMFDIEGECVYVIFDNKLGDLEFTSTDAFLNALESYQQRIIKWVSDNDPIESQILQWDSDSDGLPITVVPMFLSNGKIFEVKKQS